jgi:hypothetical protein
MRAELLSATLLAASACGRVGFGERPDDAAVGGQDDASADAAIRVVLISDDFERDVVGSWGDAPIGGDWFEYNPDGAALDVTGGSAVVAATTAPTYADFNIDTGVARDVETRFVFSYDRVPAAGIYRTNAVARQSAAGIAYDLKTELNPDGSLVGYISTNRAGTPVMLTTPAVALTGVAAGERIAVMLRVSGIMPTQVCGSIWRVADGEPVSCTYSGQEPTAILEAPGLSFIVVNVPTGTAPVTVSFDSFEYLRVGPQ